MKITKKEYAKKLWKELEDVPIDDDDCIEQKWPLFPIGTDRNYIWQWFESKFDLSIAKDLM